MGSDSYHTVITQKQPLRFSTGGLRGCNFPDSEGSQRLTFPVIQAFVSTRSPPPWRRERLHTFTVTPTEPTRAQALILLHQPKRG